MLFTALGPVRGYALLSCVLSIIWNARMSTPVVDFIHDLKWADVPADAQAAARLAMLDLLGVAASGTTTSLSKIIRQHAFDHFAPRATPGFEGCRIMFDGRRCSAPGAILAGGMQIDSVDAHDGHKLTKGHVGCGVLPTVLAFSEMESEVSESDLMGHLLMAYEIGARAGIALHQSVTDYHTSGAWIALATASIGARSMSLSSAQTREALGIAEYHGPRSQMMRCIDYPTMLKDGSGWGAMAGASASLLARDGFTGSPALTIESDEVQSIWSDLGTRWTMLEHYIKAYPVCRWAQPAIAAVLKLHEQHQFSHTDIAGIEIGTFHESKRLAVSEPADTEQAQYSLPFPVAVAAVHKDVSVAHIGGDGLNDKDVLRLSQLIQLVEVDAYNERFPANRISHVIIELNDGQRLDSGPTEAAGDPEMPFSAKQIEAKFVRFAAPVLSEFGAIALADAVRDIGAKPTLSSLNALIYRA